MREHLLNALREAARRSAPLLPTAQQVAELAGVDADQILQYLGPAENYAALLSYQQPAAAPDTRERILEAAAQVFAKKGLQKATLDEVAAAAGMTKGAIYWHFKSKSDLFFALLDHRFQQYTGPLMGDAAQAIQRAEQGEAMQGLAAMFRTGLKRCTADSEWARLYFECLAQTRDADVRLRFQQFYARGWDISMQLSTLLKARGLAPADEDPWVAAVFWGALFDGLIMAWYINPDLPLDELADKIFHMLWRGIAPDATDAGAR